MYEITLPSGMKIGFRGPRNIDRKTVMNWVARRPQAADKDGSNTSVELLATYCLQSINGVAPSQLLNGDPDWTRLTDEWDLKDTNFYHAVFLEMFFLTDEADIQKVKDTVKNLLSSASEAN